MKQLSIVIGKWMVGISWEESLPSLGKVRLFVFDMESDEDVWVKPIF
jgi:hypothetical protein